MDPSNALLDFVQLYIVQGDGFTGSAPEAIHIAILGELTNATPEAVNRVVVDLGALLAVITRPPSQPDGILRACRGCVAAFDLNGSAKRVSPAAHRRVLALQFLLELLSHQECPPLLHYHKKIILAVSTALSASHMLPEAPRVAELVLTILGKLFREGKHDLPSKLDTAIVRQGYDSYFRVIFPAVNNPDCRVVIDLNRLPPTFRPKMPLMLPIRRRCWRSPRLPSSMLRQLCTACYALAPQAPAGSWKHKLPCLSRLL
jgi:hypothetical protein